MDDDRQLDLALWRYGIISPLLHREANGMKLCDLLKTLSEQPYIHPNQTELVRITSETMRKWLYRYNHGGLTALADKSRSDKGRHNVPQQIVDEMFALRKQHPRWTLALLLTELVERKVWDETSPSRSVLYRFAKANNLMRDPHIHAEEVIRPFCFEKFGQMWIADFMHGPKLWVSGKKKKCYLHLIIDDCTRYVVTGHFYQSESTQTLIRELMIAVRRFGIPWRFYADNGAAYSGRHLKIVAANLGMILSHTPPGRPQGRSKCERFFRNVRDQFLARRRYKTFEEINHYFIEYLEEYHNRIHSTLKCTPMQKRLGVDTVCKKIPEVVDIEALFRLTRRCKVYKDGTIRLNKKSFEVPGCLPGSRVCVHYMPWDLSRIYYGDDMRLAKKVDLSANAHRFDNPNYTSKKENIDDKG